MSSKKTRSITQYQGLLVKTGLNLRNDIVPLNPRQQQAFDVHHNSNLSFVFNGFPGTGKTFLALYFAFKDVMDRNSPIQKVVVIRPPVSTHDQGFLPGNIDEKMDPYTVAYQEMCNTLFERGDAYGILKKHGILSIESTSYLRSRTFDNHAIILEEMQNASFHEADTFITRTGTDSRVYLAGDYYQSDLKGRDRTGILEFLDILNDTGDYKEIQFEVEDCVRSDKVKNYLIAKMKRLSPTFRAQVELAERVAAA